MKFQRPYIFFKGYCLDISDFIKRHPGGTKVLQKYYYQDMTTKLYVVFPHNQERVVAILEEYSIGLVKNIFEVEKKWKNN